MVAGVGVAHTSAGARGGRDGDTDAAPDAPTPLTSSSTPRRAARGARLRRRRSVVWDGMGVRSPSSSRTLLPDGRRFPWRGEERLPPPPSPPPSPQSALAVCQPSSSPDLPAARRGAAARTSSASLGAGVRRLKKLTFSYRCSRSSGLVLSSQAWVVVRCRSF